jgi:tRNA pseudouridine38-40 synthase
MHRLYSWHFPQPLDLEKMRFAAKDFLGTHNFSAFTNERTDDAIRTLESIVFVELDQNRLKIELQGDRFLYKMARTIVGTLAYVGCNKLPADCIPNLFARQDRTKAGVTAPAHGLFLWQVNYS